MIVKICLSITVLYYLALWRFYAKKSNFERSTKEVFGAATGIQDLLAPPQNSKQEVVDEKTIQNEIPDTADIFGPTADIKSMIKDNTQTTNPMKTDTSTKKGKPPSPKRVLQSSLSQQLSTMGEDLETTKNTPPVTRGSQALKTSKNIEDKNAQIEELHRFFE